MSVISQDILMNLICNICSEITLLKLLPRLLASGYWLKLIFSPETK